MILCVCRAVSDRLVRSLAAAGVRTVTEIEEACGAGTGCGACRQLLAAILEEPRPEGCPADSARPVGCGPHHAAAPVR